MHPELISRERYIKSPALKVKTFIYSNTHFRENDLYHFRKFEAIFVQKKKLYNGW